jgi:hypothetical protein
MGDVLDFPATHRRRHTMKRARGELDDLLGDFRREESERDERGERKKKRREAPSVVIRDRVGQVIVVEGDVYFTEQPRAQK